MQPFQVGGQNQNQGTTDTGDLHANGQVFTGLGKPAASILHFSTSPSHEARHAIALEGKRDHFCLAALPLSTRYQSKILPVLWVTGPRAPKS